MGGEGEGERERDGMWSAHALGTSGGLAWEFSPTPVGTAMGPIQFGMPVSLSTMFFKTFCYPRNVIRLVQLRSPATAAHDTARTRELTVCVPWCDCLFTQARPRTVAERDDEELRRRPYSECTDEARGATPFILSAYNN